MTLQDIMPKLHRERALRADKKGIDSFTPIVLIGTAIIAFLVLYPIVRMIIFGAQESGVAGVLKAFSQPWFGTMLRDTLTVTGVSALAAVLVATILAWLNERTDASLGVVGDVLPLVPLFLPAVATAIGWVMLAAPRTGFLNGLLFSWLPADKQPNIYTMPGLIFVYTLTLVPYAYLPISAAFRTIDLSREEAARVSGAGSVRVFFTVALRSVMPAVAGSFVLVGIVAFALYSVPVVIASRAGLDILSFRLVNSVTQQYPADYNTATGLSLIMFVVLAILFAFQQRVLGTGRFTRVGERTEGASRARLGPWRWVARGFMILYLLASSVLPMLALILVSFQTYWNPNILGARYTLQNYISVFTTATSRNSILNSTVLGITVGAVTVVAALFIILFRDHATKALSRIVNAISRVSAVLSSAVIGVAFIIAFAGPPFQLGATIWIIAIGYLVVFLPYAVTSMESARAQIHPSLTEASEVNGAEHWRTVRTVIIPLMAPGLFAAWGLVFVLMNGELSLAALLSSPQNVVVGLVLRDYWDQGSITQVTVVAVVMTAISAVVVGILLWIGRPRYLRRG